MYVADLKSAIIHYRQKYVALTIDGKTTTDRIDSIIACRGTADNPIVFVHRDYRW